MLTHQMHAPPGPQPTASPRRNHVSERNQPVSAALTSELVNRARRSPELEHLSANAISRAVRRFVQAGLHERDLVSYVVGYSDPTGETAVRNIMAGRS